jgi:hypothetical protein
VPSGLEERTRTLPADRELGRWITKLTSGQLAGTASEVPLWDYLRELNDLGVRGWTRRLVTSAALNQSDDARRKRTDLSSGVSLN